jgi:predicted enzyme related to lactoylglutathione lyase
MPICQIDIPAKDFETIKNFYQGVFGWKFEQEPIGSWSIDFGSAEAAGAMTGGIVPRSAPTQPIGCYFRVPSVEESSARIQQLGGVVFVPKTATPGKGYYACCLDPEENYFLIWEDDEAAG